MEILLLTLRNRTYREQVYRIAPVVEIVLAETPPDLVGALEMEGDDSGCAHYFPNPRNEFVKSWAFVSTSLDADWLDSSRAKILGRKILGARGAEPRLPYLACMAIPIRAPRTWPQGRGFAA